MWTPKKTRVRVSQMLVENTTVKGGSMDHQTILVRWMGPIPLDKILRGNGGGLYMFSGRQKYQRNDDIQYIGITERDFPDRFAQHHKLPLITRNLRCWIGSIICPVQVSRSLLERAESIFIYFVQPQLNQRKTISIPWQTTIISHWYKTNGEARYNQQGLLRDFPDVISWDGASWRKGNLRVWDE